MDQNQEDTLKFTLITLDESIYRLTQHHHEVVYQDEDQPTTVAILLPPLLEQLKDAIGSSQSSINRGQGLANTRAVLDFSALALLNRIQTDMKQIWNATMSGPKPKNLYRTLKTWQTRTHQLGPNQEKAGS